MTATTKQTANMTEYTVTLKLTANDMLRLDDALRVVHDAANAACDETDRLSEQEAREAGTTSEYVEMRNAHHQHLMTLCLATELRTVLCNRFARLPRMVRLDARHQTSYKARK